jgi:hypothetical protein
LPSNFARNKTEIRVITQENATEVDPAILRTALVREGLLRQEDDTFVRPTFTADHPALVKLREETFARHNATINEKPLSM